MTGESRSSSKLPAKCGNLGFATPSVLLSSFTAPPPAFKATTPPSRQLHHQHSQHPCHQHSQHPCHQHSQH
eukprot:365396-Chlamydomonas_euryale.AAC.31